VGYSQGILKQVEESKFIHNQRVLNEAKQTLLQYAYNYPVNNPNRGPGRLPCPDTDNNGTPNPSFNCISGTAIVGRFPWNDTDMNFYDARDASDERLWYAVSSNFANQISPAASDVIHSETTGTITLVDQSQNIIYDGNGAGIAAIIIAAGSAIARDEDDNGTYEYAQVRGTVGQQNDPRNYLDTFNGFVNNTFTNGESDTDDDGFILGPIRESDPTSPAFNTIVVNDQMIVITAAEVIEVAEKATLQAYQNTINDYLTITGNVYPWLYNYIGVPDVAGLSSYYPALDDFTTPITGEKDMYLDNFGRIPSIFADYFTETNSQPIESKLSVALSLTYPITPTPVGYNQSFPVVSTGNLLFNNAASHAFNFQSADILTNLRFVDIADIVGKDGQLTGTVTTPETITSVIYFWDEDDGPPTGIWTECGDDGDGIPELSDCHRTSGGIPNPGGPNDNEEEILRVVVTLDFTGIVNFDTDYTTPLVPVSVAATPSTHASITATIAAADVIVNSLPLSVSYEIDRHYHDAPQTFDVEESGTLDLADLSAGPLTLGMRYYPELPDWVFDNGWHNSLMMAYAANYRPDILGACAEGTDCIQINNFAGNNDNKVSILTLAGQHNWDDDADSNFINDLPTIFDAENADILDIDGTEYLFDRRELGGNDKILVIDEL